VLAALRVQFLNLILLELGSFHDSSKFLKAGTSISEAASEQIRERHVTHHEDNVKTAQKGLAAPGSW
jgi:hypothetical protein